MLLSNGPPTSAVLPSAESATLEAEPRRADRAAGRELGALLDQRVDHERVRRAAVRDADLERLAATLERGRQRAPARVDRRQRAVAQPRPAGPREEDRARRVRCARASPARRSASVTGPAVPAGRLREREALLDPERAGRVPLRQPVALQRDAVRVRAERRPRRPLEPAPRPSPASANDSEPPGARSVTCRAPRSAVTPPPSAGSRRPSRVPQNDADSFAERRGDAPTARRGQGAQARGRPSGRGFANLAPRPRACPNAGRPRPRPARSRSRRAPGAMAVRRRGSRGCRRRPRRSLSVLGTLVRLLSGAAEAGDPR